MNPKRNMRSEESSRQDMVDQEHEEDRDYKDKVMTTKEGALILMHMKRKVLDVNTARELEDMKCKFLGSKYWNKKYSDATKRKRIIQETEAPKTLEAINNVAAAQGQQSLHGELPKPKEEEVEAEEGLFHGTYAPPDVPHVPRIQHLIQVCSKPFEKQLTRSDVRDDQSRLAMNKEDVENHIFPLLKKGEDASKGIHVITYDVDGNECPMMFKTWVNKIHVLIGGWKNFYHDHGLIEKQDFVTLWVFRNAKNGSLCFVISSRRLSVYETIKKRRLWRYVIAPIAFCVGYIIGSDQATLTHDIESGRELMITTTPHRQLRLWCYVIFSYRMSKKSELLCIGGDECTVRLETFEEQDKCAMLGCRHVCHRDCIEMWLDVCGERLSPICRQEV